MAYVDGFLIPVRTADREQYRVFAERGARIFRDHGALAVVETWGDEVPDGERTSMTRAVALEADEAVVFSWVVWPSKAVREEAHGKVFEDPRWAEVGEPPVAGARLIYGSFDVLVADGTWPST